MKKTFYILLIALLTFSCTDDFEEYNQNKKDAAEVPGETLFSNAQRELSDQIASTNVNLNIYKLFAQYWTETTYTDEANYDITNRAIPDNIWAIFYRDILKDLKQASELMTLSTPVTTAETVAKANKLAITEIMAVYAWHRLVDTFGDIPYSQALDIDNVLPAYDDAAGIYTDLLARIDAAIAALNVAGGSFASGEDLIYDGDVALWKKFAYTIKLKLGMHLADVNPTVAKANVEAAYAHAIASAADNATFEYLAATPNTNPLYVDLVAGGRHDFVAANTIVDAMNALNDPRLATYFDDNITPYKGGTYGASSAYPVFTHINPQIEAPDFENLLASYTEVEFYLAEAAARGWSVGGTAAEHYNKAIEASIIYWGGTAAEAATYIAQPEVDYATVVAATSWKEAIALQAWIGSYTRGFIAWTTWRRLDSPVMNIPPNALSVLPLRMTYSNNEQTLNGTNYTAAATAIGGDVVATKLFWDIH